MATRRLHIYGHTLLTNHSSTSATLTTTSAAVHLGELTDTMYFLFAAIIVLLSYSVELELPSTE